MKILLSGGSGMVGRNVREHRGAAEHEWLSPSHAELDLLNYRSVEDYLGQHRPDAVVHAAGRVGGIHANMKEPVRFLVENLDMGRNLLLAAREHGVRQFINLGSSCIYPRNRQDALREEDILTGELEPTNEGYALAKIAIARLSDYISREDPAAIYRTLVPCNLYGRYDSFDPSRSHLIPAIIHKVHHAKVNGLESVEIWGDGEARREFLYAADLADAILRALASGADVPGIMNIGYGEDHTVNEFYRIAAEVIGYQGAFVHDLTKPVGMSRKLTSIDRAKQWGWSPSTSLRDGLRATYDFYLQQIGQK